jgi:spore germination protein KA
MEKLRKSLQENAEEVKKLLPAEDILLYSFTMDDGTDCAVFYADGMVDKLLLGAQVARPLLAYRGEITLENVKKALPMPEVKEQTAFADVAKEVLTGNAVLFVDGLDTALALGVKSAPARAVAEPPTGIVVKGPRAGFTETLKTNTALLRTCLKTGDLRFLSVTAGKRSNTAIEICYLKGIAKDEVVKSVETRLQAIDIDGIPDSSYIASFLAERKYSLFRQVGTTEKPDILAAKLLEGRVGLLVDGSPIALTVPYILMEDFQSSDDYFVSPYRATFNRFLRAFSLALSVYLPAIYVAAQLFELKLLPLGLLLTVASSIQSISLSPSLEMMLTLIILEVLVEASIRMPKYVGLALSVVGALVLGDTAVNAGLLSTPAILIVALSGICLYTVPDLIETTSILRLLMLLAAGSIGPFGVLLFTAFLLYYLFSAESYGAPLLSPFAPVVKNDLKDSLVKYNLRQLDTRPVVTRGKNKVRFADEE